MDTPKLRLSQEMDDLLASVLPNFTNDELMLLLSSPAPEAPPPPANIHCSESVAPTIMKPTEKKKKRTPWNKGLRKSSTLTTARNQSFRKRRKLSNVAPVVELPPITIIEDDYEVAKSPITTTIAQTKMSAMTSAMIELGEAQRLSDATLHERFARRATTDATLE